MAVNVVKEHFVWLNVQKYVLVLKEFVVWYNGVIKGQKCTSKVRRRFIFVASSNSTRQVRKAVPVWLNSHRTNPLELQRRLCRACLSRINCTYSDITSAVLHFHALVFHWVQLPVSCGDLWDNYLRSLQQDAPSLSLIQTPSSFLTIALLLQKQPRSGRETTDHL